MLVVACGRIDAGTDAMRRSLLPAVSIAVDGNIWVADPNGELRVFDAGTAKQVAKYPGPREILAVAYAAGYLWAVSDIEGTLWKVDPADGTVTEELDSFGYQLQEHDGDLWAISPGSHAVRRFDPGSHETSTVFAEKKYPVVHLVTSGDDLWIVASDRDALDEVAFTYDDPEQHRRIKLNCASSSAAATLDALWLGCSWYIRRVDLATGNGVDIDTGHYTGWDLYADASRVIAISQDGTRRPVLTLDVDGNIVTRQDADKPGMPSWAGTQAWLPIDDGTAIMPVN